MAKRSKTASNGDTSKRPNVADGDHWHAMRQAQLKRIAAAEKGVETRRFKKLAASRAAIACKLYLNTAGREGLTDCIRPNGHGAKCINAASNQRHDINDTTTTARTIGEPKKQEERTVDDVCNDAFNACRSTLALMPSRRDQQRVVEALKAFFATPPLYGLNDPKRAPSASPPGTKL